MSGWVEPKVTFRKRVTDSTALLVAEITNRNPYQMDIRWVDIDVFGSHPTGESFDAGGITFSTGTTTTGARLSFGEIWVEPGNMLKINANASNGPFHIAPYSTGHFDIKLCRNPIPKVSKSRSEPSAAFSASTMTPTSMNKAAPVKSYSLNPLVSVEIEIVNPDLDGKDFVAKQEVRISDPDVLPNCPTRSPDKNTELEEAYELTCLRESVCQ
ncbi:hypothetical protein CLH62_20575 [Marinobacter guineae]|uniref:Uncharacterized protein n=2 Tax=Marinobacter guineae TaxID=432303 RepID=A0A2G1VAA6_9GAMM|nr:hypothetical protein CLH62_20575 [Marinobacter guineae]